MPKRVLDHVLCYKMSTNISFKLLLSSRYFIQSHVSSHLWFDFEKHGTCIVMISDCFLDCNPAIHVMHVTKKKLDTGIKLV